MQRRRFIKIFALTAASVGAADNLWHGAVFGAVQPTGAGNVGHFSISLDDFPALKNEFSSIRLSVNPLTGGSEPFPDGDFYPILINRGERDQFFALDSACRHAGCVVPIFEEASSGSVCPCHGSIYGIEGSVLQGPAREPLISYNITFDGVKTLTVEVPSLGYDVTTGLVSGDRLRLEFPTHLNVTYEVRFRASLNPDSAWNSVPFSLSLTGPTDRMALPGSGEPAILFVDRSGATGFYAVNIVLLDVT
jgi:Rieske Fe-S protein